MASGNNSTRISQIQAKNYADSSDQVLAYSSVSGNDVITPVGNLFSNGLLTANQLLILQNNSPSHSNSYTNNTPMTIWSDGSYIYLATSANNIVRTILSTF